MESASEESVIILDSDSSDEERKQADDDQDSQAQIKPGSAMEVYSGSYDTWVLGRISKSKRPDHVIVKYSCMETPFRKKLQPTSKNIRELRGPQRLDDKTKASAAGIIQGPGDSKVPKEDPEVSSSSDEGGEGSGDFTQKFAADTLINLLCYGSFTQTPQRVAEVFKLRWVEARAFTTRNQLKVDCELNYVGPHDEDVVIRAYQRFLKQDTHHEYRYAGSVHAMQPGDRLIRVRARGLAYHLAIEINTGLNKQIFEAKELVQMQSHVRMVYNQMIMQHCETRADLADFLVCFVSRDPDLNNTFLWRLQQFGVAAGPWGSSQRSVSFCTDTSLGLGFHYDEKLELCLGSLGFAKQHRRQTKVEEHWWKDFAEAANQTAYGVLVVDTDPKWKEQNRYQWEFAGIHISRQYFYVNSTNTITPWKELFGVVLEGMAPIIRAASRGEVFEVDTLLLQNPQALHTRDVQHRTPLHFAALYGHELVITQLLTAKADLQCWSSAGKTPLHLAALGGHAPVIQQLLKVQADAEGRTFAGRTPLHFAALGGREAAVRMLIGEQADVHCQDQESDTPLDYALNPGPDVQRREDHDEVVDILRQHGAVSKETLPAALHLLAATGGDDTDAIAAAVDSAIDAGVGEPFIAAADTKVQFAEAAADLAHVMEMNMGESHLRKAIEKAAAVGVDHKTVKAARDRMEKWTALRVLKEAMRSRDETRLREALSEAKDKDVDPDVILEGERLDRRLVVEQELLELTHKKDKLSLEVKIKEARELEVNATRLKDAEMDLLRLNLEAAIAAHDEEGLTRAIAQVKKTGIFSRMVGPAEAELRTLRSKKALIEVLKSTNIEEAKKGRGDVRRVIEQIRQIIEEAKAARVMPKLIDLSKEKLEDLVIVRRLADAIDADDRTYLTKAMENATRRDVGAGFMTKAQARLRSLEIQDKLEAAITSGTREELERELARSAQDELVASHVIERANMILTRLDAIIAVSTAVRDQNENGLREALNIASNAGADPGELEIGKSTLVRMDAEKQLLAAGQSDDMEAFQEAVRNAQEAGVSLVVVRRAEAEQEKARLVKALSDAIAGNDKDTVLESMRSAEEAGVPASLLEAAEKKLQELAIEDDLQRVLRHGSEVELRVAVEKGNLLSTEPATVAPIKQRLAQLSSSNGLKDAVRAGDTSAVRHWFQVAKEAGVDVNELNEAKKAFKKTEATEDFYAALSSQDDQQVLKALTKAKDAQLADALVKAADARIIKIKTTKSLEKAIADKDGDQLEKSIEKARKVGVNYATIKQAENLLESIDAEEDLLDVLEKGDEKALRDAIEDAMDMEVDEQVLADAEKRLKRFEAVRELDKAVQAQDEAAVQRCLKKAEAAGAKPAELAKGKAMVKQGQAVHDLRDAMKADVQTLKQAISTASKAGVPKAVIAEAEEAFQKKQIDALTQNLRQCIAGNDADALEKALDAADKGGVDEKLMEQGEDRLDELLGPDA